MVTVLLSTYNGEDKFLRELLDSLKCQTYPIHIFARDDGSVDKTGQILEEYKNQCDLEYFLGENVGAAKSFMNLLSLAPESEYYAFCDQDDVWDADKIEVAVKKLSEKRQEIPLLYMSTTRPVDENLKPIPIKYKKRKFRFSFGESLLLSAASGCTFVFNKKLRDLFVGKIIDDLYIHDWYVHKVAAAFGEIIYDIAPHISYRQHQNNVMGYGGKNTKRLKNYLLLRTPEPKNTRLRDAVSLKKYFYNELDKKNQKILDVFTTYKEGFFRRLRLAFNMKIKVRSFIKNCFYFCLALKGEL